MERSAEGSVLISTGGSEHLEVNPGQNCRFAKEMLEFSAIRESSSDQVLLFRVEILISNKNVGLDLVVESTKHKHGPGLLVLIELCRPSLCSMCGQPAEPCWL